MFQNNNKSIFVQQGLQDKALHNSLHSYTIYSVALTYALCLSVYLLLTLISVLNTNIYKLSFTFINFKAFTRSKPTFYYTSGCLTKIDDNSVLLNVYIIF